MFDLNLQNALKKDRDRRISSQDLKALVQRIFDHKEATKAHIKSKLVKKNSAYQNSLAFDNLDVKNVENVQEVITDMSLGMSTALCTTLVGLVSSVLTKIQMVILENNNHE